jgi:hypothetical protein
MNEIPLSFRAITVPSPQTNLLSAKPTELVAETEAELPLLVTVTEMPVRL